MATDIEEKIQRCKGYLEAIFEPDKANAVIRRAIEIYQSEKNEMPVLKSKRNLAFMNLMDYMIFVYKSLKQFEDTGYALKLAEECFNYSLDLDYQSEEVRAAFKDRDLLRRRRKAIIEDVNQVDEEYGWTYDEMQISDDIIYSFNVKKCGMYTLCKKFGVEELMPHICQGDYYLMKYFPDGYFFHRKSTLADGAEVCDFLYPKVQCKQDAE